MKTKLLINYVAILFAMGTCWARADEVISFGPQETKIEGLINYSLIGKYTAHFNNFNGRIIWDEPSQRVESVYLEIDARSIQSNHHWCDRLARSRRLLDAARYPKIIFKSDKIMQDGSNCQVKGVLDMHGIKRKLIFPFRVKTVIVHETGRGVLELKGSWNIDRKDFNIIWSKYLDHGGVVVSDIFTVNWDLKTYIKL